jgi:hypothetical protein
MSKFAIGAKVDNAADDHEVGTVIAIFPTVEGSVRYAVDMEGYGALQFFAEEKLVVHPAWSIPAHVAKRGPVIPREFGRCILVQHATGWRGALMISGRGSAASIINFWNVSNIDQQRSFAIRHNCAHHRPP